LPPLVKFRQLGAIASAHCCRGFEVVTAFLFSDSTVWIGPF
jgi:hypothetical protein